MTGLLEMRGIVRTFGPVRANDGIDLDVPAGRIVGLLGENGSGKSTLMKLLFGMLPPDAAPSSSRAANCPATARRRRCRRASR